jgi:hypothetical protein
VIQHQIALASATDGFRFGFHVAMIHCNFVLNR